MRRFSAMISDHDICLKHFPSAVTSSVSPPCFSGQDLACRRGERVVFARLSFALEPGEAILLVGPNGSGKSSFLRLLAGLSYPAAGGLFRKEQPISKEPETHAALLRYVGHLDAINPVLSVAESLVFWGELVGLSQRRAEVATTEAIGCFGLESLADTPGRLLSAGQKRQVNLARLLLGTSDLWLLDEPTVALDQNAAAVLAAVMAAHRARGGMVILSTHSKVELPQAQRLNMCDFAIDLLLEYSMRVDGP